MTERLYYGNAYLLAFNATVRTSNRRDDGRTQVTLDRTAFYPTSGGQPFDTGRLDGAAVIDVIEEDDGTVAHVIDGSPPDPGSVVHGEIDWDRRFDHMQQHTGQHLLSAAFHRVLGAQTVGFHLGADASTIDLMRDVSAREAESAEAEANRVVWENRPVETRYVTAREAASMPLRKESQREGLLRIIDVEGFDISACGGTHVSRTGSVGLIAITASERFKSGQRVTFVCGRRAHLRFRRLREIVTAGMRLLSTTGENVPAAVERLHAEHKAYRRRLDTLQVELAHYRASELAADAEQTTSGRLALGAIDGDAGTLKSLAAAIVERQGHMAVLVSTSAPTLVVLARAEDLSVNVHQVLGALMARFGGRGGGTSGFAQGGGLQGAPDLILQTAKQLLLA